MGYDRVVFISPILWIARALVSSRLPLFPLGGDYIPPGVLLHSRACYRPRNINLNAAAVILISHRIITVCMSDGRL